MKKKFVTVIITALAVLCASASNSEVSKQKKQEIADRLYEIELSGGDHLGYCSEILQHLEKSARIKPSKYRSNSFDDIDRQNMQGGDIDLYSLMSGRLEIRESLKLEKIRPSDDGMREIDPSKLNAVAVENRPYEKMLGTRKYKTWAVDRLVPEEFYYIHFNSAYKALESFNLINETAKVLYKRYSYTSVDFMVRDKILTQLALREKPEVATFYSDAVSEIVITGSDPFIVEGSDITLIIRPQPGPLFSRGLQSMRRYTRDRYSAKVKEIDIAEFKASHIYTEDRQVWSLFFTLPDGTVIISNSVKAAEKVAAAFSGKTPSISDAPDYRYIRSIYPAGTENEDGFFYLSDKFMRHIVSPQLRVKEARRMYEGMKIAVLERYMIFHYQLTGRMAASVEEAMDSTGGPSLTDPRKKELDSLKRYSFYSKALKLGQEETANWDRFRSALSSAPPKKVTKGKKSKKKVSGPDDFIYDMKMFYKKITGEQAYTPAEVLGVIEAVSKPGGLDSTIFRGISVIPGTFSAKSGTYGRTNYMVPLVEIETGNISKREGEEYRRFAESYSSDWKSYNSPAALRIKTAPSFSAELYLFPPAKNPFYSLLSGISGGTPIELHPESRLKGDIFSIAMKVNPLMIKSLLALSGVGNSTLLKSDLQNIFTGEVQFHMGDAAPAADFDPAVLSDSFSGSILRPSEVMTGFLSWVLSHPLRISIPVKKTDEGKQFVNTLINGLIENSSGNSVQSESYLFTYNRTYIRTVRLTFFQSIIARIYIAEKDNFIHISNSAKNIRDIIDLKPAVKNESLRGNAFAVLRPSEIIMERDLYSTGMIENALMKSRKNLGTIKLMGMIFPDASGRDLPDLAYKNFGFKPVCPLGGEYIIDRKTGAVKNSVFGSDDYPVLRIDENSTGTVPLYLKRFFRYTELKAEIEFTSDGVKTKLTGR